MDKEKIGPKEAAAEIRDDFRNEHAEPRYLHQVRFAKEVLKELGEQETPESVAKVMRLLDEHKIEGHSYQDYPAWVQNERGERAVVNDEDHEKEFMARPEATDEGGVPNPDYGHVDPQTGVFVGNRSRVNEPYGSRRFPPPYEPGAVPVIEHGGQKGPEASPVSDNRINIQGNVDQGRRDAAMDQPVEKVRYGEIITEPASAHGNTVQPDRLYDPQTGRRLDDPRGVPVANPPQPQREADPVI